MKFTPLKASAHLVITAGVVVLLLAGLLGTALLARATKAAAVVAATKDFTFVCSEIQDRIADRLSAHEQILRSGMAFIAHAENVTRQEWQHFVADQRMEQQFPGLQGLGFALLIPQPELAQHLQAIRAEGFPDYQVRPGGDRAIYSSIIYLEPFTNRNLRAFGYDMLSEPVRRAAMERARDQNVAALSGRILLVQETEKNIQAGTLMYLPVYRSGMPTTTVDHRRAAIRGWVYSPFRMTDLLRGIMRGRELADARRIHLEIFDGDQVAPAALLYDSQAGETRAPAPSERLGLRCQLVVAGCLWTLRFTQTDPPPATDRVWLVWLSGITASLLLVGFFLSLLNTRFKALQTARQLAVELRESAEQFRAMFQMASIGMAQADTQTGQWLRVNPKMCTITGYSAAELLQMRVPEITYPEDRAADWEAFQRVVRGEVADYRLEKRYTRKDGIVAWVEVNMTVIRDAAGQPARTMATIEDITDRKQAEARLRDNHRQLEAALAALRQTQEQIIQQEKLRGLGQMASGIAHDFNNALSPITGFAELLLKDPAKTASHPLLLKWLQNIRTCANDATQVVHRLREFSRQQADDDAQTLVDFNSLIRQMLELTQPRWKDQAQSAGCTIQIVTDLAPVPAILGEEFAIREIFTNLIFNAVDALPAGGTITLGTAPEGPVVRVWISDTGTGMTSEAKQRCFEPFFTTKGVNGSGLGLAMVHGIVHRHGGTVTVESELGQGTTFTMRWPIPSPPPEPTRRTEEGSALVHKLHILVVDDEPLLCAVVAACLTSDGHTAVTVATGAAALAQLESGPFDLVITDKAMPEMNGEQLAQAIHQQSPNIPVILMTGFGDLMEAGNKIPLHVRAILCKPITLMTLRAVLDQVVL